MDKITIAGPVHVVALVISVLSLIIAVIALLAKH